jgi:transcription elongation factor GreA
LVSNYKTKELIISVMAEVAYYTKEGIEKLKEELQQLKTSGRANIAKAIAEARDKGDLSENAEYDAAKEAQGHHESKIAKMEELLSTARLLDESKLDSSKVLALSIVKIKNTKNGATMSYQLVSESEADLKSGKISVSSPIAKGLLGKKVGETTEITVPAGKVEFEILEISR